MLKRIITTLVLVTILALTLVGCSSPTEVISLNGDTTQGQIIDYIEENHNRNVYIYKTKKCVEYLKFLEVLDESRNEILDVTTCMFTGPYTSNDFYMITYRKLDEPRDYRRTGKVSLFKTQNESDYLTFMAELDLTHYEIIGISTSMFTDVYSNDAFYMVTFREI